MKRKNPSTSNEAFRSLDPDKINEIHKRILEALKVLNLATFEDLAEYLHLDPQRVWRRLSELGTAGLIHRPGDRKIMKSGRQGMCWKYGPGKDVTKQRATLKGPAVVDFAKAILNQPNPSSSIQNKLF